MRTILKDQLDELLIKIHYSKTAIEAYKYQIEAYRYLFRTDVTYVRPYINAQLNLRDEENRLETLKVLKIQLETI